MPKQIEQFVCQSVAEWERGFRVSWGMREERRHAVSFFHSQNLGKNLGGKTVPIMEERSRNAFPW